MREREEIVPGRETQECLWHMEQAYLVGAESLYKNTEAGYKEKRQRETFD